MSSDGHIAERCSAENTKLYPPSIEGEKYDLYNGLANLAGAVGELERTLASIDHHPGQIDEKIDWLRRQ